MYLFDKGKYLLEWGFFYEIWGGSGKYLLEWGVFYWFLGWKWGDFVER